MEKYSNSLFFIDTLRMSVESYLQGGVVERFE